MSAEVVAAVVPEAIVKVASEVTAKVATVVVMLARVARREVLQASLLLLSVVASVVAVVLPLSSR